MNKEEWCCPPKSGKPSESRKETDNHTNGRLKSHSTRKAMIPISAVLGAYHITSRYLRVPRLTAKKILQGILDSGSPALLPLHFNACCNRRAYYASIYNIESWDGYLIALARSQGATIVYSLDRELSKVKKIARFDRIIKKN